MYRTKKQAKEKKLREQEARSPGQTCLVLFMCEHPEPAPTWFLSVEKVYLAAVDGNGILQAAIPCPLCMLQNYVEESARDLKLRGFQ